MHSPDCLLKMCPALASVTLLLPVAAIMAVVVPGPGTNDIYALIGAAIAAIVVVFELSAKERAWGRKALIFLVSVFTGIAGPGGYVYNVKGLEYAHSLSWHAWAIYGLIFGLIGWVVILAFFGLVVNNKDRILRWAGKKFLGIRYEEDKENQTLSQ